MERKKPFRIFVRKGLKPWYHLKDFTGRSTFKRNSFLPVAHRLPFGVTLNFGTLLPLSVREILSPALKDIKTRYAKKPQWQTLVSVSPLILTRTPDLSSWAQFFSKWLFVGVGSLQTHPAFIGSPGRGGLSLCAAFTFHSLGCVNEDDISQLSVMPVRNLSIKRSFNVKRFMKQKTKHQKCFRLMKS